MKTKKELMDTLGLIDFQEYRKRQQKRYEENPKYWTSKDRATGRTTSMLVDALYQLQSTPIVLVTHTHTYGKELKGKILSMSIACGLSINPDDISVKMYKHTNYRDPVMDVSVFIDHHCSD